MAKKKRSSATGRAVSAHLVRPRVGRGSKDSDESLEVGGQMLAVGARSSVDRNSPQPVDAIIRPKLVPRNAAHERLVRALLENVPLDEVMATLREYVTESNRADQMLEALALRGELAKPRIDQASGPSWSTEQAGKAIGKSSETIRNYVRDNRLVGYTAVGDQTRLRIPQWQFDAQSRPHDWVSRLIAAFGENGWPLIDFVTVPRDHRDGKSYLLLLLNGQLDDVIAAARRSNPD
jgi:hypothetical protein